MVEPKPYAFMGGDAQPLVKLLYLAKPAEMNKEQEARLRARVVAMESIRGTRWGRIVRPRGVLLSVVIAGLGTSAWYNYHASAQGHREASIVAAAARTDAHELPAFTERVDPGPLGIAEVSAHDLPTTPVEIAAPKRAVIAGASEEDALLRELRLVDGAKRLLEHGKPATALEGLAQHRLLFPSGQLRSERDVLTVEALSVMGKLSESLAQARAIEQREPGSPYARRALAIVSRSAPSTAPGQAR